MRRIPNNMRMFDTIEEANEFAATLNDAVVTPEVANFMWDENGNKINLPLRVWVEYNFVEC